MYTMWQYNTKPALSPPVNQGLLPSSKNNLDAFLCMELSYMFTLWYKNIEKNIGTLHSDKLSFSPPCTEFLHSLQSNFHLGKM